MNTILHLGKWTEPQIEQLLQDASGITSPGDRIDFLSQKFLGTPYKESTLIGDARTAEAPVINLEGLDCLTFIEYIEAMRRSASMKEFIENTRRVRYRNGIVSFKNRNHFFTDWKAFNAEFVIDVTRSISGNRGKDVSKRLNEKHDGTLFVPGISSRLREVTYIPSGHMDTSITDKLANGDYIGIYSKKDGLDVSHTGILIRTAGSLMFRHASSTNSHMKVIDDDFIAYLKAKAGIIVFRPRS